MKRALGVLRGAWHAPDRRWAMATIALLAGCGAEPTPDVAPVSFPVVGGTTVAGECAWPSTVQVDAATGCTGTLIHPRIVTTAAHCLRAGGGSARITFGGSGKGRFSVNASCKAGATGESGVSSGQDWGYCVLPDDERIRTLPTIPPLVGCEAEKYLKAGSNAWVVGFGATGANGAGFGTLRQVEVKLNRVTASVIDVGDAQKGACHGDSGGPLYVQLRDGERDFGWRLAGSTSGPGGPCDCACSTVYVNIAMHVAAIEKAEGLDVTPCTNSSGAWAPSPDCSKMQQNPAAATGTFPSCVVARTTNAIETCGPNASSGAGGSPSNGGATSTGGTNSVAGRGGNAATTGNAGASGNAATTGSAGASGNAATTGSAGASGNSGASGGGGSPTFGPESPGGRASVAGMSSANGGQVSPPHTPSESAESEPGCSCTVGRESHSRASLAVSLALAFTLYRRRKRS